MKKPEAQQLPTRQIVGRLMREHIKGYIPQMLLAVLFMALVAATTAAYAWMVQPILDEVFIDKDHSRLMLITVAVLVVFVVKGLADYAQTVIMARVSMRIVADIRQRVFESLIRADLAFFHGASTGELIAGCMNNVDLMRDAVANTLTAMAKDVLTLIFLVALMFYQDWALALVAFFVFPLAIVPVSKIGRKVRMRANLAWAELEQVTGFMSETFRGVRHIKAYGQENHEIERARDRIETLFMKIYKTMRAKAAISPIMETLAGVAIAVIIVYGGDQVIAGTTTAGAFFSFITALLLAYQPLKNFAKLNNHLQEGLAAAQRVLALVDIESTIRDRENAGGLEIKGGTVDFENVTFAYGDVPALNGISITVPAGKTAALVGPSGAGKSTVLNLMPRFYDVSGGAVRIDGTDVRDVTITSLRRNIAIVSQEVALFNDTVGANIAYGRMDASQEEIERAARDAAAHDFIMEMPQGYDTVVGESGIKLSGGQRQRLSIARAILRDAPILLLDEATSALDSESERQVQTALARLAEGRTTLVVAHRLSTIADADIIYVMEDGAIAESGSHTELVARGGLYARLRSLQVADEPAALKAAAKG
ncbi:MAG: ABC transporter ATP-binding protein [Rhodospirillaceae bacterium]|jgi:ATP-binding cassette, subfamily B, bacterial MsbA|nr:ABC transporter ATP-binding protein [Rhodospirillaceae bacterium]MBT6204568.1 ABC transporter ATP-binding protein [Rhodospirillaceae bacterium]MBT6510270.1 ABC transporter ATP-binding protein [Rhodospirillaceae bacterium]MBT7613038.1 ABC transporter ATP-binding protein [Rhodospirillaceae bacterium]